ncbi:MAG: L-serine ammonia-lyase [Mesorhizobium sp.]|nr:MAG: L-serine ammonia-lyase [Mesorhizobium sp.]
MFLSVFDLFKIGIGPSSSHTMGPMTAARRFLDEVAGDDWPRPAGAKVDRIAASLHGSLAYTGIGHGSDRAVVLGLAGQTPQTVDPDQADNIVDRVAADKRISPPGHPSYRFDPATDLVLDRKTPLSGHANGMAFFAYDADDRLLLKRIYYSIGGGFVVSEEELQRMKVKGSVKTEGKKVPYCIERGLSQDGIMPGGLKVRRRARQLHDKLQDQWRQNRPNPLLANDWLSIYAMAVNEENAAGGRVVTAPTNGAAGTLPAVLRYWLHFHPEADQPSIRDFLLTAAAIGGIIKTNASISGAEVGCQGEVGSASAMAAAGLCAVMGGTPEQVENAAEIALEHHLGMTCDPVGGLVQVPCIERNALGAVKAVTAASLAIKGDGVHFVPLDAAIETMRQTGLDMNEKYKETSLGGLAVNIVEC